MPATSDHNLLWALGRAVDGLRRARVPYALIGAWAVAVWGRLRATLDLDFLVMVSKDGLGRLGTVMARSGMAIDEAWLINGLIILLTLLTPLVIPRLDRGIQKREGIGYPLKRSGYDWQSMKVTDECRFNSETVNIWVALGHDYCGIRPRPWQRVVP